MRLKDRIAIVTGSGSGIGAGVAERFAAEGAEVVCADLNQANAETVAARLRNGGGRATAIGVDVTDYAAVEALVAGTVARAGRLDILVNSAGISQRQPFLEVTPESFRRILSVNLDGTLYCGQWAARAMAERGYGRIVNIASISGYRAGFGRTAYGTSKAAVIGLTRQMAVELGPLGITVNAVGPGPVDTPLTAVTHSQATRQSYYDRIPMKRYGEISEMADAATFLASDEASFVNGQILYVDGGFSAAGVTA